MDMLVGSYWIDVYLGRGKGRGQHLGSRVMDWFFFSKVRESFWRVMTVGCGFVVVAVVEKLITLSAER